MHGAQSHRWDGDGFVGHSLLAMTWLLFFFTSGVGQ